MKDRWTELCESAVTELDQAKFRAILRELHQLLDERGSVPARRQTQWYPPGKRFDPKTVQSRLVR
jgi:hypothetical protein